MKVATGNNTLRMSKRINQLVRTLISGTAVILLAACGGGGSSDGTVPAVLTSPSVSIRANQTIDGFPHLIDMYVPSNAEFAVIFLHGGGGHKEKFESDLGIKSDASAVTFATSIAGQTWLTSQKVLAIFPQGQTLPGYNAWTWNNYVMNSGQDDVAFLQALAAAIRADHSLPAISKIYLVGHSNGGMMANRMWCESPDTFDGYGALAGPPSIHLDPTLTASSTNHPCDPVNVKPYIGVVGNSDEVLRTSGNMGNPVWVLNPALSLNPAPWVDSTPAVLNDQLFYGKRVALRCAGTPAAPIVNGQISTYSDCNDTLRSVVVAQTTVSGNVSGGDHCLVNLSGPCVTTLAGDSGIDYKSLLVDFLKTH